MEKQRLPLSDGMLIILDGRKYRIDKLISNEGASCLVYLAERLPNELNAGTKVVLKELYPLELATHLYRTDGSSVIEKRNFSKAKTKKYEAYKEKFKNGIHKQIAYSECDMLNHSFETTTILAEENGTFYAIFGFAGEFSLSNIDHTTLTPCEKAQVMVSLCNAISCLHEQGKLHLDIKPSNIFLFPKQENETRRIALFDFDSVVSDKAKLPAKGVSSRGWSPPEQIMWNPTSIITEAADVYAVGAVFYWLLIGETLTDEISTNIVDDDFDFLDEISIPTAWGRNAILYVKKILSATLIKNPADRVSDIKEIAIMSNHLDKHSETATQNKPLSDKMDDLTVAANEKATKTVINTRGQSPVITGGSNTTINYASPPPQGTQNVSGNTAENMVIAQNLTVEGGFTLGGNKQNS